MINTGIAGSLDANIDIGDMVISTDAVEHDMDASNFRRSNRTGAADGYIFVSGRFGIGRKSEAANEEANPDIHTFVGRIVSGDQFVSSAEVKEKLVSNFGAKCTEMEGGCDCSCSLLKQSFVRHYPSNFGQSRQQCDDGLSGV